jgi:hypothetical protein
MRRWIRQVHLYLGLLVSPYLIIYGLSSLEYNHRGWFSSSLGPVTTSNESVDLAKAQAKASDYLDPAIPPYISHPGPTFVGDRALAQATRDELGLSGFVVAWEMHRDSTTQLRFNIERPGRHYVVKLNQAEAKARITSQSKGLWSTILSLHGLYSIPNARFVSTWGVYTEITTWVVCFFAISGVYLWFARRTDRRPGLIAFGLGLVLSALVLLTAWMGG